MNENSDIVKIARVCHEANRAWCEAHYDYRQKSWSEAEQWQRDSAVEGVKFALANPRSTDNAQHEAWMNDKIADGWTYGETKNSEKKTHPCLVPFVDLPVFQQLKDKLFRGIVRSLEGCD